MRNPTARAPVARSIVSQALTNSAAVVCVLLVSSYLRSMHTAARSGEQWSVRKVQQPGQQHHVSFERPPRDVRVRMQPVLAKAVTTVWLPSGERVRVQMNPVTKGQDGHWRLPDMFYMSTVYAVSAWNPRGILEPETRAMNDARNDALRAAIDGLQPRPDRVLRCATADAAAGRGALAPLQEEGFALIYDGVQEGAEGTRVDYAVEVLARRFGRTYVYRWRPYVWGGDAHTHASVIQTVLPTGAGMPELRSEGHAYRVTAPLPAEESAGGSPEAAAQAEVLRNEQRVADMAKWDRLEKEREQRREWLAQEQARR